MISFAKQFLWKCPKSFVSSGKRSHAPSMDRCSLTRPSVAGCFRKYRAFPRTAKLTKNHLIGTQSMFRAYSISRFRYFFVSLANNDTIRSVYPMGSCQSFYYILCNSGLVHKLLTIYYQTILFSINFSTLLSFTIKSSKRKRFLRDMNG